MIPRIRPFGADACHPLRAPRESVDHMLRALTLLTCLYFALWACAPPSVVAPLVPFDPGHTKTLGGSVVGSLPLRSGNQVPSVAFWVEEGDPDVQYLFSASASYLSHDDVGSLSVGGGIRRRLVASDRLQVAVQIEGGVWWVSGSLPLSVCLGREVWLYTAPQVGKRMDHILYLPVGVSVGLGEHARTHLYAEAGWRALERIGYIDPLYGTVGMSWRP